MDYFSIAAFATPIIIVLAMAGLGASGWKTNVQGTILLVLGGVQTMDWSFIPAEVSSALMTGSGVAVLIASGLTKRVKTSAGPGYDDPGE